MALASVLLLLQHITVQASVVPVVEGDTTILSGNLAIDLANLSDTSFCHASPHTLLLDGSTLSPGEKSVWLAGALSAVVPGAGQVYSEAPWWRTALYVAVEAAGWTAFVHYNARGDEKTMEFEQYADANWDVTRYVQWIAENYQDWPDEEIDKIAAAEAINRIYLSIDENLPPWEQINFEKLNELERLVNSFSHTLPEHGDQQYYEEIGKYVQYRAGWVDHNSVGDTMVYDPSYVTTRQLAYMDQRGEANILLGHAMTAVTFVIFNHLISMIDAALEAKSYNVSLHANLQNESLFGGELLPTANIGVNISFR